ncbi:MAG: hypothetical protein RLZZ26_634 [Candidatus Parcubacteria bacterium]|jgi:hypothetical protein
MITFNNLVDVLVLGQAFGALVGALTSVGAQRAYVKAMRDGHIDHAERAHLTAIGHGLRYGLTIMLISSFCLVVAAYLVPVTPQPALTPSYWMLVALALIIISISSMLARRRTPFKLASATIFTAWWFLVFLSFGWVSLSFGAAMMSFIVTTAIFYAILYYARLLVTS